MHASPTQPWRLLDRATIVFLTLSPDGVVRLVDGPAESLFGGASRDLVGTTWLELVAPRAAAAAEARFAAQTAGELGAAPYELVLRTSRGRECALAVLSPVHSRRGELSELRATIAAIGPLADRTQTKPAGRDELSPRQKEVLELLARGDGTGEIARELGVTEETVRHHVRGVFLALGAHSRLEAVLEGVRRGLIRVD